MSMIPMEQRRLFRLYFSGPCGSAKNSHRVAAFFSATIVTMLEENGVYTVVRALSNSSRSQTQSTPSVEVVLLNILSVKTSMIMDNHKNGRLTLSMANQSVQDGLLHYLHAL